MLLPSGHSGLIVGYQHLGTRDRILGDRLGETKQDKWRVSDIAAVCDCEFRVLKAFHGFSLGNDRIVPFDTSIA